MEKNKGLADNHDGEIILNESATSISTDAAEETETNTSHSTQTAAMRDEEEPTLKTDDPVTLNDIASDEHSRLGEGLIKPYDGVFHDHKPYEDAEEISSTDDV